MFCSSSFCGLDQSENYVNDIKFFGKTKTYVMFKSNNLREILKKLKRSKKK